MDLNEQIRPCGGCPGRCHNQVPEEAEKNDCDCGKDCDGVCEKKENEEEVVSDD